MPADVLVPWVHGIGRPRGADDIIAEPFFPDRYDQRVTHELDKDGVFYGDAPDALGARLLRLFAGSRL